MVKVRDWDELGGEGIGTVPRVKAQTMANCLLLRDCYRLLLLKEMSFAEGRLASA